ncbi:hypothetical protein SPRG_08688 [Saprolegnia parasitica CBS 223.65]|uniref:Uncharacterized protein n=1 Tax=Saprolegnia parasitica (strain CBS 223.65) TaxID=695850 RepID=A0A067CA33_SAPPC|nr:hypothetical protein SPRG_08688 [Saprolegnia parasitica CBS 223.65]KDO26035.1 hypothetical protein SPRG_08688 [Saprolegnia parasitica CBS 223.65]|eukprot:XP_012203321.1 hypothetical protein SPRG_08688 [Saprolegnia parasitica CBS 223.65]
MWRLWVGRDIIRGEMWLGLYNVYVLPTLLYSCDARALTAADADRLESLHGQQLHQLIGVCYPHRISNNALNERCQTKPLRSRLAQAAFLVASFAARPTSRPTSRCVSILGAQALHRVLTARALPRTFGRLTEAIVDACPGVPTHDTV